MQDVRFIRYPVFNFLHLSIGNDKAVQLDLVVVQTRFNVSANNFCQSNLRVSESLDVIYTLRVNERHILLIPIHNPEDEIRVEIVRLKEADAFPALVAQQIKLLTIQNRPPITSLIYLLLSMYSNG